MHEYGQVENTLLQRHDTTEILSHRARQEPLPLQHRRQPVVAIDVQLKYNTYLV